MSHHYPKPAILSQIPQDRDCLIEASAGTGKTYTIEHLVIDLLLRGVPIGKILIVTFTDKATSELNDRVREKITEILHHQSSPDDQSDPSQCWTIDDAARKRLEDALFDFDDAAITTIHGYCNRVLRELAFENGQRFELEQRDQNLIFDDCFSDFLRDDILSRESPLRGLLAQFLREKPNALNNEGGIIKKARDLFSKNGHILPDLEDVPELWRSWLDWFRSVDHPTLLEQINSLNVKRSLGHQKNWSTAISSLHLHLSQEDANWPTTLHILSDLSGFFLPPDQWVFNKPKKGAVNHPDDLPSLVEAFRANTTALASHAASLEAQLLARLIPSLRDAIDRRKRLRGWFDFDDMIRRVAAAVKADGSGAGVIRALRGKHTHALIDEFQDTDEDQWLIFSSIFLRSPDHRLFLIGDPKQAIYRFRGADIHTYLRAREELASTGGVSLTLTHNYRSSPQMIEAFNAVFNSPHILSGHIQYEQAEVGRPNNQLQQSDPTTVVLDLQKPDDKSLGVSDRDIDRGYSRWIASIISELLHAPPQLPDDKGPLAPRHIAVLVHTRSQAKQMGDALTNAQVPWAFYKQAGLFQTREARDLCDILAAIERPFDDPLLFKALLTRFFPVDLDILLKARTIPHQWRDLFVTWHKEIYQFRDYRKLFNHIFERTHLFERLLFCEDAERQLTNYQHLADLLKAQGARLDLSQLVRWLRTAIDGEVEFDQDLLRLETEKEAVQIMTIHASKGLEFEAVFVHGFRGSTRNEGWHEVQDPEQGRIIDLGKRHPQQHVAEQQEELERLYYVALTRAKYKLWLTLKPRKAKGNHPTDAILNPILSDLIESGDCPQIGHLQREYRTYDTGPQPRDLIKEETCQFQPQFTDQKPLRDVYYRLRHHRNRFTMTSYTQLAHGAGAAKIPLAGLAPDNADAIHPFDEVSGAASLQVDKLPRGKHTGICLHEILERVTDLKTGDYEEMTEWRHDEDVKRIINYYLNRSGLGDFYDSAAEIVWNALTVPLIDQTAVGPLHPSDRLHEVDFYFPLHKEGKEIMLNGSIDLAFRREQRYYFADWKSDALDDFRPSALHHKVEEDYGVQARIYLLAMLRWLGIRDQQDYEARFGGFFYLFLRGMREGEGVYYHRPDWNQVQHYEQDLLQHC